MSRRSLRVLMWKHLMVRKRRFIHTFLDFTLPILFYCLAFIFRDTLSSPMSHLNEVYDNKVQYPDVQSLSNIPSLRRVLYYPENQLTAALMDEVGTKLKLKRLTFLPGHEREERKMKGYYAIPDMVYITDYLKDMFANEAIVLFHNIEGEEWPAQLQYTIRMKNMFFTNSYESSSGKARPHRQYGEVYEEFLRLQWTIDTSYIKVVTDNEVNQSLSLQEFPYYGSDVDSSAEAVCDFMIALSFLSLFIPFVFLMSRLLEERCSGIQELVKMVGVSPNMISLSHFLNVLPVGVVYAIVVPILLKTGENPLIKNTSGVIISLILFLQYISIIALSFACSYLTESIQYSTSVSVFAYMAAWLPSRLVMIMQHPPRALVYIQGILPHRPGQWFWDEVESFEKFGEPLTWSDITRAHTTTTGSVLLAILWLLYQTAFFSAIAWYLSHVRPGPHGLPMPWNFICKREYWSRNEVRPEVVLDDEDEMFVKEDMYFEAPPKHMEPGIQIENVSKIFPKHRALSNVTLNVYRGEICVLLGHNGAGKTTLMSIITGTLLASEGRVLVNGLDIRRNKEKITKQIGLCPQHNLFFPDLTVIEHTLFFAMLKKGTYKEARTSCQSLIAELGLKEKAHTKSGDLSGGMKRRLQLACALAGGADVLVLDEPTAGLDVETRRSLWDLLLSLRGSRTVLLSTHFMEEADALGDRIAALHSGRLRCCATPLHLKKAVGTGYRLSLTTAGIPRDDAITAVVTSVVPDASLTQKTLNALAYNLPSASSPKFPSLFTSLEQKKTELRIEGIGVGVSTLEEVFLKLCSDTSISMTEEEMDGQYAEPKYKKEKGFNLYKRQLIVLFKRQVKFCLFTKYSFLIFQVILPVITICIFTSMTNEVKREENINNLTLTPDMYKYIPDPKVYYNIRSDGVNVNILEKEYPKVQFRAINDDVAEGILRTGKQDIMEYNQYVAGIEVNDTNVKILYTSIVRHAAPIAMNLLTNLLAAQYMPKATGRTITVYNSPLSGAVALNNKEIVEAKSLGSCMLWSVLICFGILGSVVTLAGLPCSERVRSSRHIHLMAGCSSVMHWGTTLLSHVVLCGTPIILSLVIALNFIDQDNTFNNARTVGVVVLLITLGILAFLASMYIVTFWMDERSTGIFLVVILVLFGVVTPGIHTTFLWIEIKKTSLKAILVSLVGWFAPAHALTMGLTKATNVALLNAYCELNRDKCPALFVPQQGFDSKVCCSGQLPRCYLCNDDYAPGPDMARLLLQFIVYMILVILLQEGVISRLLERIKNPFYKPKQVADTDEMVHAEKVFVDKHINLDDKQIANAGISMLVHDAHKNYRSLFKCFNAVKGISFSVKTGECFGLLGVNGAGKSTTFKMLTMEECATRGRLYGNGYRAENNRGKYLRTLGYCPQFFGLDEFQTGRENLRLLLTFRGLDEKETESQVQSWLGVVGLEKFADRTVSGYSGGMSRRLGAAAALGVGSELALLDEPTAGVDVAARRRVWAALRRVTPVQRSVLLTSHSMDEMEALCDRIAIMSAGRICALGSAHELRAKHALGHAVTLKLKHVESEDEVDSSKSSLNKLKADFKNKFNCVVKDEHSTMLHYHINETLHYSNLFTEMEALKKAYPELLEDYSITETTLEEVFLSFAKEPPASNDINRVV